MAKGVAVGALGELIEAEATFSPKGGREGSQTTGVVVEVQSLGAGDGDDGSGGGFPCALLISSKPPGLLSKHKPSVEGGEFTPNNLKGVRSG